MLSCSPKCKNLLTCYTESCGLVNNDILFTNFGQITCGDLMDVRKAGLTIFMEEGAHSHLLRLGVSLHNCKDVCKLRHAQHMICDALFFGYLDELPTGTRFFAQLGEFKNKVGNCA